MYLYIVTSLLSCPDNILDILIFLVPDTSAKKYVNERKFIIRPIYSSWFVMIIKKGFDNRLRNIAWKQCIRMISKIKLNTTVISTTYKIHLFRWHSTK